MIKYFSILIIILGFNFSGFINSETGWSFDQSTAQAFHIFQSIEICDDENQCNIADGDGCAAQECDNCTCCQNENFNSCDVIGAFFDYLNTPFNVLDDICVGWVYADVEGYTTVPVMGDDGGAYSENYPSAGDQVRFVIYDASQSLPDIDMMEIDLDASCNPDLNSSSTPADCSFQNNAIFLYGENDYYLNNNVEIPDEFELLEVYPNPFNPSLNIDFFIDTYAQVNISVYDLLGNLVQTLIYNDMYVSGNHSIYWQPNNISSGEYLISITLNGNFIKTEKVTYLK